MKKTEKPLFAIDLPPHIRSERLSQCLSFIHRCELSAPVDEEYSNCLVEILNQVAGSCVNLVNAGNVKLARNLPNVLDRLNTATAKQRYGRLMTPVKIKQKTKRGSEGNNKDINTFVGYFLQGTFWDCGHTVKLNISQKPALDDVDGWLRLIISDLKKRCGKSPVYWKVCETCEPRAYVLDCEKSKSGDNPIEFVKNGKHLCKIRLFQSMLEGRSSNVSSYLDAAKYSDGERKIIMRKRMKIASIDALPGEQWRAIRDSVRQSLKTILPRLKSMNDSSG